MQERQPTVTSGPQPALIYDYHGFPDEAYKVLCGPRSPCVPVFYSYEKQKCGSQ